MPGARPGGGAGLGPAALQRPGARRRTAPRWRYQVGAAGGAAALPCPRGHAGRAARRCILLGRPPADRRTRCCLVHYPEKPASFAGARGGCAILGGGPVAAVPAPGHTRGGAMDDDPTELLRGVALFATLPPRQLASLAGCLRRRFRRGAVIFHRGDPAGPPGAHRRDSGTHPHRRNGRSSARCGYGPAGIGMRLGHDGGRGAVGRGLVGRRTLLPGPHARPWTRRRWGDPTIWPRQQLIRPLAPRYRQWDALLIADRPAE